MRQMISIIFVLIVLSSSCLFTQAKSGGEVLNIALCTSIENRQPIGIDSIFASNVGKVYCFTKLKAVAESSVISHVWLFEGKEMAKIDLTMKANASRTWSSKTILPEWKGNWQVEIRNSEGKVIGDISFKIK